MIFNKKNYDNREIKQNKGSILKASVDYIKSLKHELNKSKQLEEKFRQMSLLNKKLVNRIKDLEQQQQSKVPSPDSVNSNNFNEELIQIKQEPQITLLNLVTNTESPSKLSNFSHLQKQPMQNNTSKLNYMQTFMYQPDAAPHFQSPRQAQFNQVNNMSILNEAMISDELLNSPGDPLMCHTNNLYADNLMDALNGV